MGVQSTSIQIFPCVSRDDGNVKSRLLSEENITNIIKSVTDNKSYIISYTPSGVSTPETFKFVLNGYYIELNTPKKGTKYVVLKTTTSGDHILVEGDNDGTFVGVDIVNTKPNEGEYLCLCENNEIPLESYNKFYAKSIYGGFDFGELK